MLFCGKLMSKTSVRLHQVTLIHYSVVRLLSNKLTVLTHFPDADRVNGCYLFVSVRRQLLKARQCRHPMCIVIDIPVSSEQDLKLSNTTDMIGKPEPA